jgi:uncharacterized membrane protein YccF (DUF307 family)
MPTHQVVITTQSHKHSLFTRFIWFLVVGWWASGVFIFLGLVGLASVVLAPLGFWFINRVPKVQTLRNRSTHWTSTEHDGVTHVSEQRPEQHPWYLRLLYLPAGFFLGLVWLSIAWLVSLPVITLPLSIWMIDRAPAIITLEKN